MQKLANHIFMATVCALSAWVGSAAAATSAYPSKPVRIIVPFSAGGTTDILARTFARKLGDAWGQSVVVENRVGAGGNIGATDVARSSPDGYTLLLTGPNHSINPSLYQNLSYDPEKDFAPVTLLAVLPNILAVNPSVPAKNLKELIAYAKNNPGKLSYASAGVGTASHIAGEYFKSVAGVDVLHVPYKGSSPALSDLVAGQVDYTFDYLPSALPFVHSGKLRALAVTGLKRSRSAPDLPTAIEAGLPNFSVMTWFGVYAPAGTPGDIVKRIRDTIAAAAQDPGVIETMGGRGAELIASSPEELVKFLHEEIERWSKLIKEANITAQ